MAQFDLERFLADVRPRCECPDSHADTAACTLPGEIGRLVAGQTASTCRACADSWDDRARAVR